LSYDAIIAGASFAGLTMATGIRGKVLLIDRKGVGTLPTSACATFHSVLKVLGCESSLLKVLPKINWQTSYNSYVYKAYEPFCTFDYKEFCQCLLSRFEGEFLKAQVKGYKNGAVVTNKGTYSAPVIVDCTGWRATLASSAEKDFVDEKNLCFGLETVLPYEDDKLSFIMDPNIIKKGYAWIFPIDKGSRVGLGCLAENSRTLAGKLRSFASSLNVEMGNNLNGGFIPINLRRAVVDNIFLVGDSAGQVFPLTVEGIRQSIYFGQKCASIVQEIIDGHLVLEEGLRAYQDFVNRHRLLFKHFMPLQHLFFGLGPRSLEVVSQLSCRPSLLRFIQRKYYDAIRIESQ